MESLTNSNSFDVVFVKTNKGKKFIEELCIETEYTPKNNLSNTGVRFDDEKKEIYDVFIVSPKVRSPTPYRPRGGDDNDISILGKRNMFDAFGKEINDDERYGQNIDENYFKLNVGHAVLQNASIWSKNVKKLSIVLHRVHSETV